MIGSYNRASLITDTIDSVRRELASTPHELFVVDGGSTDGTLEWLIAQKDVITIVQHNRGEWRGRTIEPKTWGYFMNLAFRAATGKYVCMLSDDCLVVPGAIVNGIALFHRALEDSQPVGAVAFYWRNWPDQRRYWVGLTFGDRLFVNHGLYLKEALTTVDYLDAKSYFFYHADGDLCLRLWEAGYTCIEARDSYIEHWSHLSERPSSETQRRTQRDWQVYADRWSSLGEPKTDWKERDFDDPHRTAESYWGQRGQARPLDRGRRV